MRDILLEKTDDYYDISFQNGDFKTTTGLDTSIIMSLLIDSRAESSEVAEPSLRRGWIGNEQNETPDHQIGSKLWLLDQSRNDQSAINRGEAYILNGLQWFLDENLAKDIQVSGQKVSDDQINFDVQFTRFNNSILNIQFGLWQNTLFFKG
jgi:phage gp46-like protein